MSVRGPFEAGERALLIDGRGRRYLVTLATGREFHSHVGITRHDDIIGRDDGTLVQTTAGTKMQVFRPTMQDYVLKMKRGAQVVYPKDIGLILIEADVYPGATVLEAGTGSGALTIALARAVGPAGKVISYDLREDFHARARSNIEAFLGKVPDHVELRLGDVTEGVAGRAIDRVVLDLPEPWQVVPAALEALRPGGIWCSYVPTVGQVSETVEALRGAGFGEIATREVLVRTWHVEGRSVRHDHRMVAHTGFVSTARFLPV
ncbi:MAG: tRNA (adenine-N1)-methyltransferase [Actinomycetota bacterium]